MRCSSTHCRRMTRIAGVGEVHLHVASDRKSWASVIVKRPFSLRKWISGDLTPARLVEAHQYPTPAEARTGYAVYTARLEVEAGMRV